MKSIALFLFLAVGCFLAARLGVRISITKPFGPPIWLPAGGAIAAFILCGYRVWPAVLVGSFLGQLSMLGLATSTFMSPAATTIEGLVAAYLVNKFAHGVKAFDTSGDALRFVLFTSVCAPAINAATAFHANYFLRHLDLSVSLAMTVRWWLAQGIGILTVAPFLVLLFRGAHQRMNLLELGELTILLVGLIVVCLLVFGPLSVTWNNSQIVQPCLTVPFLIWAAFRFCPLEAAGATFILFASAVWGTMHGYSLFASNDLQISFARVDMFVGVIGTMTLVVAALIVERRASEEKLLAMQSLLRAKMEGKDRKLIVTVRALEMEMAGHAKTRQSLRENQLRNQQGAGSIELNESTSEIQTRGEELE